MRQHKPYGPLGILPPWSYTVLTLCVIVWLTLGSPPSLSDDIPIWEHTDKIVHALMFGGLFFAVSFDWYRKHLSIHPHCRAAIMPSIFAWSALAGAVIEIVQPSFGRTDDIMDFFADVAGILLSWAITPAILHMLRRTK